MHSNSIYFSTFLKIGSLFLRGRRRGIGEKVGEGRNGEGRGPTSTGEGGEKEGEGKEREKGRGRGGGKAHNGVPIH